MILEPEYPGSLASILSSTPSSFPWMTCSHLYSPGTANFTQLVWKSTTQVGCRRRQCDALSYGLMGYYVICYYSPKGNVEGEFGENVQARLEESASSSSVVGGATTTVESATNSIVTPTSPVGEAATSNSVGTATNGPTSNATTSGPIGTATSTPPDIDIAGAAIGMRGGMVALGTAVIVGHLAIWAV
jgi:hypothetical protein